MSWRARGRGSEYKRQVFPLAKIKNQSAIDFPQFVTSRIYHRLPSYPYSVLAFLLIFGRKAISEEENKKKHRSPLYPFLTPRLPFPLGSSIKTVPLCSRRSSLPSSPPSLPQLPRPRRGLRPKRRIISRSAAAPRLNCTTSRAAAASTGALTATTSVSARA